MGYSAMITASVNADTFQHFLTSNREFKDTLIKDKSARNAISERDRKHGGARARTELWRGIVDESRQSSAADASQD